MRHIKTLVFAMALVSSSACQGTVQSLVSPSSVPIADPSQSVLIVTPTTCTSGCQPIIKWQASPSAATAEIRRDGQAILTGIIGDKSDGPLMAGTYTYSLWEGLSDAKVWVKSATIVVQQ